MVLSGRVKISKLRVSLKIYVIYVAKEFRDILVCCVISLNMSKLLS